MPTKHGFPSGPEARQKRFLAAFEGLTELVKQGGEFSANAEHPYMVAGEKRPVTLLKRWSEMFNTLIATEDEDVAEG